MIDRRKLPSTYYGKQLHKELTGTTLGTASLPEPFPLWVQRSDPERFGTDARLPFVLSTLRNHRELIADAAFKREIQQLGVRPSLVDVTGYQHAAEKARAVAEQAIIYLNNDPRVKLSEEFTGYSFVNQLCRAGENAGYEL